MQKEKMEFMCIKKPYKENFAETMTEEDARIMSVHFKYMQGLHKQGKLIIAGPVITGEFGFSVFEAESEEEARQIVENDPAVLSGIMTPTLYPYRVSLLKGRD
jgi:uncharacterized protein